MTAIFAVVCDAPAEFEKWKLQSWGLITLAWGIDELWYVDKCKGEARLEEIQYHERHIKVKPVESLEAAIDEAKQHQVVCVEGPLKQAGDAVDLGRYSHKQDAIYLFGGDRSPGLWPSLSKVHAVDWVAVPSKRGVYGYLIGAVVAQHRAAQANRLK